MGFFDTHREEHHRDSEGDSSQHSQSDNQQEHIKLVDLGVGVQQLRLHVNWVKRQERNVRADIHKH